MYGRKELCKSHAPILMCGEGEIRLRKPTCVNLSMFPGLLCRFLPHAFYLGNSDSPLQGRQDNHNLSALGSNVTGKSLESEVTRRRAEALL